MSRHTPIALLSGLLAALSVTACSNDATTAAPDISNLDRIAQAVARRADRVSVTELAHWIIEDKQDFVLIDVRPADDYARRHIDGARHIAVPGLVSAEQLKTLPKDRRVIVYSQGSETAAQAVVLLRLAGYNASLLLGGYNFWNRHVLNPDIHPTLADGEYARVPEQQAIACYFVGGNEKAQAPAAVRRRRAPAFVPPVVPPSASPPRPANDEGC